MSKPPSPSRHTHEAFWPTDLFEQGIGWVIVARFRSGGRRIETGVFLLDVACLGVKRACYDDYWTPETYQTHIVDHYIVEQLARRCGPGNFDYIVKVDPSPKLEQLFAQQYPNLASRSEAPGQTPPTSRGG